MKAQGSRLQCAAGSSPSATINTPASSNSDGITSLIPPAGAIERAIRKRRLADAFLTSAGNEETPPTHINNTALAPCPSFQINDASRSDWALGPPLISIGPSTDAVLDKFSLEDQLLPRLHILTRTVRSSRWETVLRGTQWKMTHEQASQLANALATDLRVMPRVDVKVVFKLLLYCLLR